jgi:hypothetical protein
MKMVEVNLQEPNATCLEDAAQRLGVSWKIFFHMRIEEEAGSAGS